MVSKSLVYIKINIKFALKSINRGKFSTHIPTHKKMKLLIHQRLKIIINSFEERFDKN